MNSSLFRTLAAFSAAVSAVSAVSACFGFDMICAALCAVSFVLCSVCALAKEKRRRELLNTAADVIRGFPQISGIYDLRVSRRNGRQRITAALECNTYIVRGRGENTKKQIEYALKRRFGNDAVIEVEIRNIKTA